MNNVPQPIKDKAFSLGIKPGAEVTSAAFPDYPSFIVPPTDRWEVWGDGVLTGDMPERGSSYLKYGGKWATVITPAPSEAEGLKEGDATPCGPAMRAAIVELAKELGLPIYHATAAGTGAGKFPNLTWKYGRLEGTCDTPEQPLNKTFHPIEVWFAKMRATAAEIAAKPKVHTINGHKVKVEGAAEIDGNTYSFDTIREVAKLIDP